jgi:hypothetical protein
MIHPILLVRKDNSDTSDVEKGNAIEQIDDSGFHELEKVKMLDELLFGAPTITND